MSGTVHRQMHAPSGAAEGGELETNKLIDGVGASASAQASASALASASSSSLRADPGDTAITVPASSAGAPAVPATDVVSALAPAPAAAAAAAPAAAVLSSTPYLAFWITMSMSVILFNKYLYSRGIFPFPLTLTCLHMAFAALLTHALKAAGRLDVPAFGWPLYSRTVLPIGALFACSLGLSNLAAMRLSVPFVQMCKALMPMVTLAMSVLMQIEKPTIPLAIVVTIMSAGVVLSTLGEISFEPIGFACQLGSILAEASRLVVMQALLQAHLPAEARKNPLVPLALFTPSSCLFLLPVALFYEPLALRVLASGARVFMPVFLNTATAFTLNIAVVMLVGATSGLTLTLAGIVKDILLIVTSLFIFEAPITRVQVLGYLVALYGLNCFNLYKAAMAATGKVETLALFREGLTNRPMAGYALGMVVLSVFARANKDE
jgi:hypothetical protein